MTDVVDDEEEEEDVMEEGVIFRLDDDDEAPPEEIIDDDDDDDDADPAAVVRACDRAVLQRAMWEEATNQTQDWTTEQLKKIRMERSVVETARNRNSAILMVRLWLIATCGARWKEKMAGAIAANSEMS